MTGAHEVDVEVEPTMLAGTHSFVADMDVASRFVTPRRCLMRAPLTDAVASSTGTAPVGMLMTLVDVGASDPALAACLPDWTVTQDLSVHAAGWLREGPVVVDNHLVRVGKKVVVVAAEVYDGHGMQDFDDLEAAVDRVAAGGGRADDPTLAARALLTFARIPGTAARGVDGYDPRTWLGEVRHRTFDEPAVGTLRERMDMRVVDPSAGVVELDRTPYVANSVGTINGGAQAVLIEVAAESVHPGFVATDMQVHYLSQLRVGPARTVTTRLRTAQDHAVVSVELVDGGHGDQVLALATVTLQRPPS
jgi:acyl-coenzyme A thioesterase PaaI-like protein